MRVNKFDGKNAILRYKIGIARQGTYLPWCTRAAAPAIAWDVRGRTVAGTDENTVFFPQQNAFHHRRCTKIHRTTADIFASTVYEPRSDVRREYAARHMFRKCTCYMQRRRSEPSLTSRRAAPARRLRELHLTHDRITAKIAQNAECTGSGRFLTAKMMRFSRRFRRNVRSFRATMRGCYINCRRALTMLAETACIDLSVARCS